MHLKSYSPWFFCKKKIVYIPLVRLRHDTDKAKKEINQSRMDEMHTEVNGRRGCEAARLTGLDFSRTAEKRE